MQITLRTLKTIVMGMRTHVRGSEKLSSLKQVKIAYVAIFIESAQRASMYPVIRGSRILGR